MDRVPPPRTVASLKAAVQAATDALLEAKGAAMTPDTEWNVRQFEHLYVATGELPADFVATLRDACDPAETDDVRGTFENASRFVYAADKLLVEAQIRQFQAEGGARYDFTPPSPSPSDFSEGVIAKAEIRRHVEEEWKTS